MDNGPGFASKRLKQSACMNGVELDFSRPRKHTDNFDSLAKSLCRSN